MTHSCQYVLFVWKDTDGERRSTIYTDWADAYGWLGDCLDPDISEAWEIGQDNTATRFDPDEIEDVMAREAADSEAEILHNVEWWPGQAGRA